MKVKSWDRYLHAAYSLCDLAWTEPLMPSKGPKTIITNVITITMNYSQYLNKQVSYKDCYSGMYQDDIALCS